MTWPLRQSVAAALGVLVPLCWLAAFAASPSEDDIRRDLRDAERQSREQQATQRDAADRAARAAANALQLTQRRIEAAAKLQVAERSTADVAARIDALAQRRREAEKRLRIRAKALQPLLPLIERLSLYPAETLLAVPVSPDAPLRGVLVLQGLSHQMELETEALRRDIAEVDADSEALRQEAPRLVEAEAAQKQEADALDALIAEAHGDQAAAEAQAREAASLAAAAAARMDTLSAALTALEAQSQAEEAKARAVRERQGMVAHSSAAAGIVALGAGPHGQLQPPVIGVVVKGWGDHTDGGPATGLSYQAPPGAHVFAPCGGRVVFADSFRSYGLLLIIDCGGGYHVVLAGFERLAVKLGQNLVMGAPVGVMPMWEPGSAADRPALYVELRRGGTPVNPAPWLRPSS